MADELTAEQIDAALAALGDERPQVAVLPLPDPRRVGDLSAWALREAHDLAEIGAIRNDEVTLEAVSLVLRALAERPMPADFAWRFALVSGIEAPILDVVIGFAEAEGSEEAALNRMIGVDVPSNAGSDVTDFEFDGIPGKHCLRFSLRSARTGEETEDGELWVTAAVACRRDLPAMGGTDVLAVVDTPYAEACLAVLSTVYGLVTGEYLADAVSRSATGD